MTQTDLVAKAGHFSLHYNEVLHLDDEQSDRLHRFVAFMQDFPLGDEKLFDSVDDNAGVIDCKFNKEVTIKRLQFWAKVFKSQLKAYLRTDA